jgi:hypothetical protein
MRAIFTDSVLHQVHVLHQTPQVVWCLQVFKVFVLARVTPAALRQLLGSTHAAGSSSSSSSTADTSKPSTATTGKPSPAAAGSTASAKAMATAPADDEGDAMQAAGVAAGYELPSDEVLGASNMYSTAEACLLAWMSHHMAKAFPNLVSKVWCLEHHATLTADAAA